MQPDVAMVFEGRRRLALILALVGCALHAGVRAGAAPQAPADTTKAATIAYLNQLFDWSIGVVKQLTPADLATPVAGGRGPAMTGLDLLLNAMVHTAHTRGYSDMYLRNKGVRPPTYQV